MLNLQAVSNNELNVGVEVEIYFKENMIEARITIHPDDRSPWTLAWLKAYKPQSSTNPKAY